MALIQCPECSKEISDKAANCPNCGCPISVPQPQIQPETPKAKKGIILPIIIAVIAIAIISVAVITINKNSKQKNRDSQIAEVKTAMDNVDNLLADLISVINTKPEIPYLYDDPVYKQNKDKIRNILDDITNYQKIVEDAYKNEDREFVKELDDYISTNKTYRSWDEYNAEIKKIYGDSISNEQAAEDIAKSIVPPEEEYYQYKDDLNNNNFIMIDYTKGDRYSKEFEHERYGQYIYRNIGIMYSGKDSPNNLVVKFTLYSSDDKIIKEETWDINEHLSDSYTKIIGADGKPRITYRELKNDKFEYGDKIVIGDLVFYVDVEPSYIKMSVISCQQ